MRGEVKHVVTGGLTGGQTGDVTGGPKICNSFINSPFRQLTGGVGNILNLVNERCSTISNFIVPIDTFNVKNVTRQQIYGMPMGSVIVWFGHFIR